MVAVKTFACAFATYIAKSAPPTPAKNELVTNESILCLARLMPMASAATSSSRMALKARP